MQRSRIVVGRAVACGLALALALVIASPRTALASDATTSWSQVTGQSAFSGVTLTDMTCPTADQCFATGYSSSNQVILEDTDGTWTAQTVPRPGGEQFGEFASISCVSASDCIAAGYYAVQQSPGFNIYETLIAAWNGSTWSQVSSPNQGDTYNFLRGVTCTSAGGSNQCTAVGDWESTSGMSTGYRTLIADGTETNGTWSFTAASSPDPGMTNNMLQAVSCPTATSCIAVGHAETYFQQTGNFSGALALQGTQTGGVWSWSTLSTDDTGGVLAGLDCTSATACMAVGNQGSPTQSLVETWNGSGGFTVAPSPNPGGYSSSLGSLSCVSASNCTAVGYAQDTDSSPEAALVEQWDGANW